MATVTEIAEALAERTKPANTPDWDPVGVQLGDPDQDVNSVAVCHEVTDDVVEALTASPVDLVVTYHPLIFHPTTRVLAGRSAGGRAFRLMATGASLLVTHTDFDAAPGGTADMLAEVFDLREIRPFGDDPDIGLPAIGRYGEFVGTLGTVDAMVTDAFGVSGLRVTGERDREVKSLSVVPGSGSSLIELAAEVSDVLITGDVPHHRAVMARDLDLAIVDPGHIATERPGMSALVALVQGIVGNEVTDLTGFDPQSWT